MRDTVDDTKGARVPDAGRSGPFVPGALLDETYELRSLLGSGGMAQVFEAWDRRLRRWVAIKAPWSETDPASLIAEAQALAPIRHRGVVAVFAMGEHQGRPYVVVERLLGTSLGDKLRRLEKHDERLPADEVVRLLVGIAEALLSVHAAGIAHRDVKPDNVMLAPDGRIVLMDFGLVLPQFAVNGAFGHCSGTPDYMAPESIADELDRGAAHLVDMYALGVTAFELLTGAVPFSGDTPQEIVGKHLSIPPPDVGELCPDMPVRLTQLVSAMLQKSPRDRPPGMEEVLAELRIVAAEIACEPPRTAPAGPLRVLVVEDDELLASAIAALVRTASPDALIEVVHDGAAAVASVDRSLPDLLLLDVHIPRVSGMEVCMYVHGSKHERPCMIVPVSGRTSAEDLSLLRTLGVTHFVSKGPNLGAQLTELVSRMRARRGARG